MKVIIIATFQVLFDNYSSDDSTLKDDNSKKRQNENESSSINKKQKLKSKSRSNFNSFSSSSSDSDSKPSSSSNLKPSSCSNLDFSPKLVPCVPIKKVVFNKRFKDLFNKSVLTTVKEQTKEQTLEAPIDPLKFGNYFVIMRVITKEDSGFDALLLSFQKIGMYTDIQNEKFTSFRMHLSRCLEFSTEELDENNLHQIVGKATNDTIDNDLQTILHTHMTGLNQSGGHFHFDHYDLMPYISYLHPNVRFYIYSVGHDKRRNNKTYEEETLIFTVKTTQIYTYEDSFD